MWLEAIDLVMGQLHDLPNVDLKNIKGISGSCQQHGTVFWNTKAQQVLNSLNGSDKSHDLKSALEPCLAWQLSPNWQDHSTKTECEEFEANVGGKEKLASITGSKAHHRFSGPQILKLKKTQPAIYESIDRIALVSSFLASIFAGDYVGIDRSDVCGMNLWDIQANDWSEDLLSVVDSNVSHIRKLLGPVEIGEASIHSVGVISNYFTIKYGMSPDCKILPFTGDNPGTILALPLEANDLIVSLGTSTTALLVTEKYVPSSLYHLFTHPIGKGYMGMLCYCNGALAREQIRDQVNESDRESTGTINIDGSWDKFNETIETSLKSSEIKGSKVPALSKLGFYFPLSEIIPDCPSGLWRINWSEEHLGPELLNSVKGLEPDQWRIPDDDVMGIVESQTLSIRYRLAPMLTTERSLPRRVYFVGGGSFNKSICRAMTRILMPLDGAYTLDLTDACAIGSAHKALFGVTTDNTPGMEWEGFIRDKWSLKERTARVEITCGEDLYEKALDRFSASEKLVLDSLS